MTDWRQKHQRSSVCVCVSVWGRERRVGKAVVSSFNFISCWLAAVNREKKGDSERKREREKQENKSDFLHLM